MASLSEDLDFRGLIYQGSAGLREVLDGPPITAYHGIDPTADSLHIGHLYGVCTLRRLQDAGHRPVALAGGGTGLIGDPGGRDDERQLLSLDQHAANMAGIRAQLERLLDFSPERGAAQAILVDNGDWLTSYRLVDFLRDIGKHFTINQMMGKESVRSRIERPEQGISFTEFSYMLLQACDYLHLFDELGCTLQFGGSDQWGNITMGMELIRKVRSAEAHAFTWPLLLNSDGKKYGKSVGGAIWLDRKRTSPFALYQHFMRTADDEVGVLLRFLTFLTTDEIIELDEATRDRPAERAAQRTLARSICTFVHGPDEAERAERASAALYGEELTGLDEQLLLDVFAEAPSSELPRSVLDGDGLELDEVLATTGLTKSRGVARTTLEQGGVYVNNRRRAAGESTITAEDLLLGRYVVLRRGRRDYHLLRIG